MAKKKLRGNAYLLGRLEREHRSIYDELMGGRIASVRQAALLAGLKSPPSPLNGLKREWKKASAADHKEFLGWVRRGRGVASTTTPAARSSPEPITGTDGRLLPEVVERMVCVMALKGLKRAGASADAGLAAYDYRFPRALDRKEETAPEVVRAIESWLLRNPLPAHITRPAS